MQNMLLFESQFKPTTNRLHDISRRVLNKKLREIPTVPLTLIHAEVGYGKSTALSSFVLESPKGICWYTLKSDDHHLTIFLTKMAYSIKREFPLFEQNFINELALEQNPIVKENIEILVSIFIKQIVKLKHPVTIILDNFHYALESNEIKLWLFFLLEHRPDNLHIVISTRQRPKWRFLNDLFVKGDLLEITREDLLLDSEEMQYILEDNLNIFLNEEDLKKIQHLTGGWAIVFHLLAKKLASSYSLEFILANLHLTFRELYNYLDVEVLEIQPLKMKEFLLQSSIFSVMTPEVCNDVLGLENANFMLNSLVKQHIFLSKLDNGEYKYHPLFKEYLEKQLLDSTEMDYLKLHQDAASYFLAKENIEIAIYHFQKIEDNEAIARLLAKYGATLVRTGRLKIVYELLLSIPNKYKASYPELYYFQGEIERYWSLYDRAKKSYQYVIQIDSKHERNNYRLIGKALEGKARIYLDTIQPGKVKELIIQAINMQKKAGFPKESIGKLYLLMAENLLNSGYANKAWDWLESAKSERVLVEDSNLEARILLRTGNLMKAKEILESEKNDTSNYSKEHLPQAHRETEILLSLIESFVGNAETSNDLAEYGLYLGRINNSPFVEACGWMRKGHANQLFDRCDEQLVFNCYETALNIMETINVSRGKAEPYMGLSIFYASKLDFDKALSYAKKGLIETKKVKDRWLSALINITIGITNIYKNDHEEANKIFHHVLQDLYDCGDQYGVMIAHYWLSFIAYTKQNKLNFKKHMYQFLLEMKQGMFEFFLKRRTIFGPFDLESVTPLLIEANSYDIHSDYLKTLFVDLEVNPNEVYYPGYTLVINTFGSLNVKTGKMESNLRPWQREKAKELFGLLVTNRNRLLWKSDIYQALWPNEKEEAVNARFKVTFNTLLKTLEPNRKARENSFFISRKANGYQLRLSKGCLIDVVEFERKVKLGLKETNPQKAITLLEGGLNLYKGQYLADLRQCSWSQNERDWLQLLYIQGSEKIAQMFAHLNDFTETILWCEKILRIDQTWEEAYRLLMYSFYQRNNRPQALYWYKKCCAVLKSVLSVEPTSTTINMYQMMMESKIITID